MNLPGFSFHHITGGRPSNEYLLSSLSISNEEILAEVTDVPTPVTSLSSLLRLAFPKDTLNTCRLQGRERNTGESG